MAAPDERAGPSRRRSTFTQEVIDSMGPNASPRTRQVIGSLIQHLHDFCRENEVTVDEFMQTLDLINAAGKMSDEKRNETLLLSDILGVESLIDTITFKRLGDATDAPTASAILGPFYRHDSPRYEMGASIVQQEMLDAEQTYVHGRIFDFATGQPIEHAELDVWHTAPNGMYEQQDEEQPDFNLRGRFTTARDGRYSFYCLKPTKYPVPHDGPAGTLLKLLDRHPYRPAHIHFIVTAPGYKPVVTQIFDRQDEYIGRDTVFAVKDSLIVDFTARSGDPKAKHELRYDFALAPFTKASDKCGVAAVTVSSTAG